MRSQTTAFVIFVIALFLVCTARCVTAAWQIETVPCSMISGPATMKLGAGGFPYIALKAFGGIKEGYSDLLFIHKDISGWHEENVAALYGSDEGSPIIEVDKSGFPHIFYACMVPDIPPLYFYYVYKIARKGPSGWNHSIVDPALGQFWSPWQSYAFALDTHDVAHSFRDRPHLIPASSKIYYDTETVITASWLWGTSNQLVTDLAMDSGNNPHICYRGTLQSPLTYLYKDGSGWHTETVDSTGNTAHYLSIALDSNNLPHISYYESLEGDLKYAHRDAGGWHVETVDSAGDVGMYNAIDIDSFDGPHVGYYDATNKELKYARRGESGWHIKTVDSVWVHTGTADALTSLDIDALNRPHIFYWDGENEAFKYAFGSSACQEDIDCEEGEECVQGECQIVDASPSLGDGPFVAAGTWPVLSSSQSSPTYLRQNTDILWTFSDDFASCSEGCTHAAEYSVAGSGTWTPLSVSSDAAQGYAWVELPVTGLQNATTYAFRFTVTDCAGQTTASGEYYARVGTSDAPPAITGGPWLAAGTWPALPTSVSGAAVLSTDTYVLWTFDDDYSSCSGLCTHRARFRRVGEESWMWVVPETDPDAGWYAYTMLPVASLEDGTYQFQFDVRDCAGQYTFPPHYYHFKVE